MSNNHFDEELAKVRKWDSVIQTAFAHPNGSHSCPFCCQANVRVKWKLFIQEPRTASFDAFCPDCCEKTHSALFLPEGVGDCFPPDT